MSPTDLEERIRAAEGVLSRLHDWIGRYDNRASGLIGIDTGMLGVLAIMTRPTLSDGWLDAALILSILFIGISFSLIIVGTYPRMKGPKTSFIFFGRISEMSEDEFKKSFKKCSEDEYLEDLLGQCHINSKILNVKFKYLRNSLLMIVLAIIPWSIALYLA